MLAFLCSRFCYLLQSKLGGEQFWLGRISPMGGLSFPIIPLSPSSQRVNLGQALRDWQPAIITTYTHKRERPGAGKGCECGGEGLIERKRIEHFTAGLPLAWRQDWMFLARVSGPVSFWHIHTPASSLKADELLQTCAHIRSQDLAKEFYNWMFFLLDC